MRLYSGNASTFLEDSVHNRIADKMVDAFFQQYRYKPSPSETRSWRNSLGSMSQVLQYGNLLDTGIILEYELPLTSKRLDCMVLGHGFSGSEQAVVVELKQWETCQESPGQNEVATYVGGAVRDVLHPAAQVRQYRMYLEDYHTAFASAGGSISVDACSYLHNYKPVDGDVLFSPKFQDVLADCPVFCSSDATQLIDYLQERVGEGGGAELLKDVEAAPMRASKKLMEHVAGVIKGRPEYILLDEQLIAYDRVLAEAAAGLDGAMKSAIVIKGGPGTGKSVIAINLMADLLKLGKDVHYSTGSKAFTETLRKVIGARGSTQFKYFNSYMNADQDSVDVVICDEAHRIRKHSWNRFTKKENRTDRAQIDELLSVARLPVFLLDNDQVVRPDELGSAEMIIESAKEKGFNVLEYELEAQFRCLGSEGFINWINNTLGVRRTANVLWTGEDGFDFRVIDSPELLEKMIRDKAEQGASARMVAGFCWPWSKPTSDGFLVSDVVVGDFKRPWNAKSSAGRLAKGIPKESLWAHEPTGIDQVGCVYTAQGFEFDYVGVIVGPDLVYDFDTQEWRGHKEHSYDTVVKRSKEALVDLLKNTYRVLMTRGLKGCYVHFMDKDTERFFRSRMEISE
jgi:uncharacterized protein